MVKVVINRKEVATIHLMILEYNLSRFTQSSVSIVMFNNWLPDPTSHVDLMLLRLFIIVLYSE